MAEKTLTPSQAHAEYIRMKLRVKMSKLEQKYARQAKAMSLIGLEVALQKLHAKINGGVGWQTYNIKGGF